MNKANECLVLCDAEVSFIIFALIGKMYEYCSHGNSCLIGTLRFKASKFGSGYFTGCNGYPKCKESKVDS